MTMDSSCSPLRVVPSDGLFRSKAPCPYCRGEITCTANAWEKDEDGSYFATDLDIDCSNEPPLESKRWNEWNREHGQADCNDAWHNLHDAMIRGMKRRFRFNMDDQIHPRRA